jgi:hypothetical protein
MRNVMWPGQKAPVWEEKEVEPTGSFDVESRLKGVAVDELTAAVDKQLQLMKHAAEEELKQAALAVQKHNPKYVQAQKEGKVDYSTVPLHVLEDLARVMQTGAEKYGRFNWRRDSIEARTYIAAILRHTIAWAEGQSFDYDSGIHPLAHVMACCALVMDAQHLGKLIDNRLTSESLTPPALRET